MKQIQYKDIEAFVLRLWKREVEESPISDKENQLLKQWKIHTDNLINEAEVSEAKARVLNDLENYFAPVISLKQTSRNLHRQFYKIAAAAVIIFTLGSFFTYSYFFKPQTYVAEITNKKVYLKDGSTVNLFPGAELTVERSFPADTRIVRLKGDAIFSVAKSKEHPFIVEADGFSTKVLGTVFKISQMGKEKAVDLYEGKVAVSYSQTPMVFLKPNQKWTNFGIERTAGVISSENDRNSGNHFTPFITLSFNDVALKEVTEVLKKNYNIGITYPEELADKKVTVDFTGGTADENMDALAFILGLKVHKADQNYILK